MSLPEYPLAIREEKGKLYVYDPLRKKYVRFTPEEFVRQRLLRFLIEERNVPMGLIAVERGFELKALGLHTFSRRIDVLVFDRMGKPLLLAECKAQEVPIQYATVEQIATYSTEWNCPFWLLTNGINVLTVHFTAQNTFHIQEDVPMFEDLLAFL